MLTINSKPSLFLCKERNKLFEREKKTFRYSNSHKFDVDKKGKIN